jgi:uncharacterized DUF497 family protein
MFEFDPKKSAMNEEKHGIDFIDAQQLWMVPSLVMESKFTAENRFIMIAELPSGCWTAIFTKRANKIRIISVRRSRKNEKEIFYAKR